MTEEYPTNRDVNPRKPRRPSRSIAFPIVLILLGTILLLQRVGNFSFDNWWALFILIPALSAFGSAFALWQNKGRFTIAVWSTFYGGVFPLLVALMFLFNLDWGDYWPAFVIVGGFGLFVSGLPFKRPEDEMVPAAMLLHRPWAVFTGLSATLLGLTFLGFNLGWIESFPFIDLKNWWGIFILLPALGGLTTTFLLLIGRHSLWLVLLNLAVSAMIVFTGVVALFNLDWNLLNIAFPVFLILLGLWLIVSFSLKKEPDR